ncbi:hypothetical protein ABZ686_04330, partial [Streptomyces sp. NPDC006992]|uniref:hypothetical protein n=1 Tax=Streptomyces sp. NPDC006992 TaxID=3155601 RepID=UPI0033EAA225
MAVGGRPPARFDIRPADPAPEGGHQPGIVHGVLCAFCVFCVPGRRAGRRGVPQFGHEVLLPRPPRQPGPLPAA